MSDEHWFERPPDLCVHCGQPWDHESHKRRCEGTFSGFGAGFAFCKLEQGHDGPHLIKAWNGSEHLVETIDGVLRAVETKARD